MRAPLLALAALAALAALLAACAHAPSREAAGAADAIAITHATVIDGRSDAPLADWTVIVRGTRIAAEGPAATTAVPDRARVIDGRGKFLIPGLWDMHVHTVAPDGRQALPLYIANGVTGVRDMAGDWPTLVAWRAAIARGSLVGPRMVASGPYLEGGDVPIPHRLVRTPADAAPAVDSLVRLGVDFIKVHGQLTRESYFAIARAARARHIPFAGHVPRSVGAAAASDSGQRSIEHLLTIPNECTREEAAALRPRYPVQSVLGECVTGGELAPLIAKLARNGTWVVPTLVAAQEIAVWPTRAVPGDSLARWIPDSLRRYVASIFEMPADVPPGADSVGRALFAKRLDVVAALHRAGVHVMAGTDAPLRNSPPGFGLHHELELLVRAELSPIDALRAATIEPARFLGALDSLGTVERGKVADLVLLDANPLDDIRNTRRVRAVVANGRLFEVRHNAGGHLVNVRGR